MKKKKKTGKGLRRRKRPSVHGRKDQERERKPVPIREVLGNIIRKMQEAIEKERKSCFEKEKRQVRKRSRNESSEKREKLILGGRWCCKR